MNEVQDCKSVSNHTIYLTNTYDYVDIRIKIVVKDTNIQISSVKFDIWNSKNLNLHHIVDR